MTTTSPWSPAEAKQFLDELKASGLSVARFARQRGIAAHRLRWALRKARSKDKKLEQPTTNAEFSEVVVSDCGGRPSAPIELRLPGGRSIYVTRDFDEVALRRLLSLMSPC